MGSKQKREQALAEIIHSWRKMAFRRDHILRLVHEYLYPKERQKADIANRVKGGKSEEEKHAADQIKNIAREQKGIAKEIEQRLEQSRLLIIHQKKKIKEFEKNL